MTKVYLLSMFPWLYLAVEIFLFLPLGLYLGGKIMKLQHPRFTYWNCLWMNLIAGLLAGFVMEANQWAGLAVFVVLLAIMIKKQFQATNGTTAIMIIINAAVAIGLTYLKTTVLLSVLGIGG